ncbi:MAG TPA: hypothetical protein VN445_12425 [Rectinemataceae bacterium]|nr:hypothetical protein [Rectinemataceae bacterium]
MTILLDKTFPRALDEIVARYGAAPSGTRLECWTFDDEAHRREAERTLASRQVRARIRSAYKPLVHYFLEDVDRSGLASVEITYPVHPGCPPDRFLLEAYPLSALWADVAVSFAAGVASGTGEGRVEGAASDEGRVEEEVSNGGIDPFTYLAKLAYADGHIETHRILAPNRSYVDHIGETCVTSAGWMLLRSPEGAKEEKHLQTEYEAIYAEALKAVTDHEWGGVEPFFDSLSLRVTLPVEDIPLPLGEEALSLREALHEELYFSILELFQKKTGRPVSDRRIRPGQVVPEILYGEVPTLRIELKPLSAEDMGGNFQDLEIAEHSITAAQVASELALIEGSPFQAKSYSGRVIAGKYHKGSDAAVMISGGQHANETSGVIGALRAAGELARRPGAHFEVSPLENPDGYALHRLFCVENPKHMHHAARYTALGNDLEYQEDDSPYEKAIRVEAQRLTDAKLHINLHGYPSHEWTRPLSGYIPRGFPAWMLPHGYFMVLRHHAAWAAPAREFLELLTLRLAKLPGLLEFTEKQLAVYSQYVKKPPFQIINGFPCDLSVNETSSIPLRLITEYPDETIHGDAFIAGHTAQKEATLAAYEIFQAMNARGIAI